MEETVDMLYGTALKNLAETKSEFTFRNKGLPKAIDTYLAILSHPKGDAILYEKNLNSPIYQNEDVLKAFKFFLHQKDLNLKIVLDENVICDEFKKLIKTYATNIQIKKSNLEFLSSVENIAKEGYNLTGFFVMDNSYRLTIEESNGEIFTNGNFNDKSITKDLKAMVKDNFENMSKMDITEKSMPTISDLLLNYKPDENGSYKFTAVELIKLIEKSQGK